MKILSIGKPLICDCDLCKSKLEIEIGDVKINEVGHPYGEYYICAVCQHVNSLEGKIPELWINKLYGDQFGH